MRGIYMDWIDLGIKAFIIILIGIAISLVITFFFPPASAIDIGQGDDVWLGETVDISLAISWPDFAVAWCKNAYPGCLPPDQVVSIEGNMHSYFIDPAVFHPGWYYRWDGKWNNGENQYAFRVRTGDRPTQNISVNVTPEPTQTQIGMDTRGNGPFEFIIARGDDPRITFRYVPYAGTCGTDNSKSRAKLWLFGKTEMLMDIPINTTGPNDYVIPLSSEDTMALSNGVYNGYVQFPGVNGRQDVFYDPTTKCLDTPYDDGVVPDVEVQTFNIAGTKSLFEQMIFDPKYSDDMIIPITVTIKEPEVIVTDITQGTDKMWISGITTWWNGTRIIIMLDPDNYALAQDKRLHTWNTTAYGEEAAWRRFSQEIPITMEEMYIGTHDIKLTVNKNNRENDVFHTFKITGTFIMPTPTPTFKKYITDINGTAVFTVTPTPTPTPTQVITQKPTTNSTNITIQSNSTNTTPRVTATRPTPLITTPKTTPTQDPNITIPLPWWLSLVATGFAVWRWRK
jgi:hypothetical protein